MSLLLGIIFVSLTLMGCASQRPALYPNEYFKKVGSTAADRDIDDCMRRAESFVSSGDSGNTLEDTAARGGTGAAIGAVGGAAGGAVLGNAGRGAAAGAAGGAAVGVTRGLIDGLTRKRAPSPLYRNFVNRCLREKGYDPIGWE